MTSIIEHTVQAARRRIDPCVFSFLILDRPSCMVIFVPKVVAQYFVRKRFASLVFVVVRQWSDCLLIITYTLLFEHRASGHESGSRSGQNSRLRVL